MILGEEKARQTDRQTDIDRDRNKQSNTDIREERGVERF